MRVEILNTDTHRNGVGGDCFVAVEFTVDEGLGHPMERLIAVIPSDVADNPADGWARCYIINPADPVHAKYRGDSLYRELLAAGLWARVASDSEARWNTLGFIVK